MSSLSSFDLDIHLLLCKHLLGTNCMLRAIICTEELERVRHSTASQEISTKGAEMQDKWVTGYSKHQDRVLNGVWGDVNHSGG